MVHEKTQSDDGFFVFFIKCIHLEKASVYVWAEKTRFLFDFHYEFFKKQ